MKFVPRVLFLLIMWPTLAGCGLLMGENMPDDRLASLTVVNRSNFTICDVRVTPASQRRWGTGQLVEPIPPGHAQTLRMRAGRWNVRLEDCDGGQLLARRGMVVRGVRRLDFDPLSVQRLPRRSGRRIATRPASWL